ncbi:sirohydrochlorin chelatase [Streptomyces lonarensis]|uniref:sirohydrochlorin chelatase n=1 Tax=Streptomyces lonarensis TaxID=700599 RepID=UPI001ADDDD67|nr:CbiX/SirB N-terminal domain-containing protein [Streptomyces lonarensis]
MTDLPAARGAQLSPPALVAVVPGGSAPGVREAVAALLRRVRALRPGPAVEAVALAECDARLSPVLERHRRSGAVVLPLVFTRGPEARHEVPAALARSGRDVLLAAGLGPHPLLADALAGRLAETAGGADATAVVLAAPGSADPECLAGTRYTADLLSARLGGVPVLPGTTGPGGAPGTLGTGGTGGTGGVGEAVARLRGLGHAHIAVAACFLAPDPALTALAADPRLAVAAPLGAHAALARLVLHRYDQATGRRPEPARPGAALRGPSRAAPASAVSAAQPGEPRRSPRPHADPARRHAFRATRRPSAAAYPAPAPAGRR